IYFSKPLSFLLCLIQKIAVTSFLPAQSFVSDYLCFLLTKQDEPIPSIGHWLYVCFLLRELFLPFSLLFSFPFFLLFSLSFFFLRSILCLRNRIWRLHFKALLLSLRRRSFGRSFFHSVLHIIQLDVRRYVHR